VISTPRCEVLLRQPDRLPEAVAAFREGTQRDPDNVNCWLRYGDALSRSGFPGEAEHSYRRALNLRGLWPGLWVRLADLLQFHLGRPGEAEEAYSDALDLQPADPTAHRGLANLHVGLGRLEQAEREHREMLPLDSHDPFPAIGLGNLLLLQDRLAEAEEAYRTAISRRSASAPAWFGLAVCMHRGERGPEEVGLAYEQAADLAPASADIWTGLGHFLAEQGDFDKAEASFRRAVAASPASAHLWWGLARLYRARPGRAEDVEEALRRAVDVEPDSAWYQAELADVLRASGKLAEAESTYRIAIELEPGEMVHRLHLAELLRKEISFQRLRDRIKDELKTELEERQKELYLREQLKIIQSLLSDSQAQTDWGVEAAERGSRRSFLRKQAKTIVDELRAMGSGDVPEEEARWVAAVAAEGEEWQSEVIERDQMRVIGSAVTREMERVREIWGLEKERELLERWLTRLEKNPDAVAGLDLDPSFLEARLRHQRSSTVQRISGLERSRRRSDSG